MQIQCPWWPSDFASVVKGLDHNGNLSLHVSLPKGNKDYLYVMPDLTHVSQPGLVGRVPYVSGYRLGPRLIGIAVGSNLIR